ncbi:hypothetical protein PG988_013297 [Apiospora saccharicola]
MANYVVYPIAFDNAGGAAGPGSAFYSAAMSQARGDIGPSDDGYDDGYDGGDVGWFRGLLRLRSGTDSTCNCRALDRNALIANIFIALFAWVVFVVVVAGLAALVDSRLRRRTRERGRPPSRRIQTITQVLSWNAVVNLLDLVSRFYPLRLPSPAGLRVKDSHSALEFSPESLLKATSCVAKFCFQCLSG